MIYIASADSIEFPRKMFVVRQKIEILDNSHRTLRPGPQILWSPTSQEWVRMGEQWRPRAQGEDPRACYRASGRAFCVVGSASLNRLRNRREPVFNFKTDIKQLLQGRSHISFGGCQNYSAFRGFGTSACRRIWTGPFCFCS